MSQSIELTMFRRMELESPAAPLSPTAKFAHHSAPSTGQAQLGAEKRKSIRTRPSRHGGFWQHDATAAPVNASAPLSRAVPLPTFALGYERSH
jgi:hypothetical protein